MTEAMVWALIFTVIGASVAILLWTLHLDMAKYRR